MGRACGLAQRAAGVHTHHRGVVHGGAHCGPRRPAWREHPGRCDGRNLCFHQAADLGGGRVPSEARQRMPFMWLQAISTLHSSAAWLPPTAREAKLLPLVPRNCSLIADGLLQRRRGARRLLLPLRQGPDPGQAGDGAFQVGVVHGQPAVGWVPGRHGRVLLACTCPRTLMKRAGFAGESRVAGAPPSNTQHLLLHLDETCGFAPFRPAAG